MDELDDTDELLAALRAPPTRPELPQVAKSNETRQRNALLSAFLWDYLGLKILVRRGKAGTPSIQTCSLYRMYLEWHEGAIDIACWSPLTPRQFCLALARAGVKQKRVYRGDEQYRLLLFCNEGSKRLIKWLDENPDPYGWPVEFAKQVSQTKHGTDPG